MGYKILDSQTLRKKLEIWVNDFELAAIREKASSSMMPVSLYVRRTALQQRIETPPPAGNVHRWQQLAPLESNLNQIAKACNSGRVTEDIYPTLVELQEQVRQLRLEILGANQKRGHR